MEKTQKIIIEIKTQLKNDSVVQEIANLLIKNKLKANMSYYENINRTEYLSEHDEENKNGK